MSGNLKNQLSSQLLSRVGQINDIFGDLKNMSYQMADTRMAADDPGSFNYIMHPHSSKTTMVQLHNIF